MTSIAHLHAHHPRTHQGTRYVYPVLSRRSRGISIGINLSPDARCTFDCVYCQVDRSIPGEKPTVDEALLLTELDRTIELVTSGELYLEEAFCAVPSERRRLNDLAFSGDGEPTSYPRFAEIVERVAERKRAHGLDAVKIVVITNATLLHRPEVVRGLAILDQNQGELWIKLDAGTRDYYRALNRSGVAFGRIIENITGTAARRPVVIQTMFLRLDGEAPSSAEVDAYCDRLAEIQGGGGRIDRLQLYTVSRAPREATAQALEPAALEAIAERVRARTGLLVEAF